MTYMVRHPDISDFFPAAVATLGDFYGSEGPDGYFARHPKPRFPHGRKINPAAVAVLEALTNRLLNAADAEIELLSIMEFCELVLATNGITLPLAEGKRGSQGEKPQVSPLANT